jgi:hypothetical protein
MFSLGRIGLTSGLMLEEEPDLFRDLDAAVDLLAAGDLLGTDKKSRSIALKVMSASHSQH